MFGKQNRVADNAVVQYRYTLKNAAGQVLESSPEGGEAYLHGNGDLVEGLEKAMHKKTVGERFSVVVDPEQGYGERSTEALSLKLPKDRFPAGLPMRKGSSLTLESPDGYMFTVYIVGFEGDQVLVEDYHPFAGQSLHYDVEILAVRKATKEELKHGHVHGAGGH